MPIKLPIDEFSEESFDVEIGAFENIGGQSVRVPITHFDFASLDSLDDLINEHRKQHGTARHLFEALIQHQASTIRQEAICAVIGIILKSPKPGLKAWLIALAVNLVTSEPGTRLARRFGVTKQDIQQGVERTKRELMLGKTSTERSEEGKQNMSKRGYRK